MLESHHIFESLPLKIGAAQLEAIDLPKVTLLAPFKGQMMAVADALKADIGMILPPAGQGGESAKAKAYWRAPGQRPVFGGLDARKLAGMAATADMSDAFGGLRLLNGAAVLARLLEVDVAAMQVGQVAHTDMAGIPVTLIPITGGVEFLVPRSFASNAVARVKVAMKSVAALDLLTL